jgi:hypothetical protein
MGSRTVIRAGLALALVAPWPAGAQAAPPRWDLVPELRIGSADRPDYDLSAVRGLAVGPQGQTYVAQRYEVRVYDARGRYLRTLGRRGSGPGEFQSVRGIGLRGDTLWVADDAANRITLFGGGGRALETLRIDSPVIPGAARPTPPAGILADGSVIGRPFPSQERLDAVDDVLVPFVQMTRAGRPIRSFGLVSVSGEYGTLRGARSVLNFSLPVQTHSLWDLASDGSSLVVVDRPAAGRSDATHFRVVRYRSPGQVAFDRRLPYRPREFPAAVRDSLREKMVGILVESGFARGRGRAETLVDDSIPIPPFQPPVSHVAAGRDGTTWLRREHAGGGTVRWLVLDAAGNPLAEAAAPAGLVILEARRDTVWGVEHDELDVPYVVRYRVRAGPK